MTNKEIKEKLVNIPEDKYIYQRYDGRITKYKVSGEYYINVEGGIAINKNKQLLLGKVSENLIDLVEVEDVIKYKINNISRELQPKGFIEGVVGINNEIRLKDFKEDKNREILEILTHELYEANCYKVGGKDELYENSK